MKFNYRSRNTNVAMASFSGVLQQVISIAGNFLYRTVFLFILSKEYLGINGLFANVLQLFSLAELGIGSAIVYAMYQPFAEQNVKKIGALVRFYKKVYLLIAGTITAVGFLLYPFLHFLVNASQVPADVDLTLVYFLFLFQSVSSYFFVYKQAVLIADQRNYVVNFYSTALLLLSYGIRTAVLIGTRNYVLLLASDVIFTLGSNFVFSVWIHKSYSEIFRQKEKIGKEEKKKILSDTGGLFFHKIGTVVVSGTDNIILSKYISLAVVGIYSNYATIFSAVTGVAVRIFTGIVPTIADYVLKKTKEEAYRLFHRILFANLWISSFTSVCLYLLINPFISLWLDDTFLLPRSAVIFLCFQHYMQVSRLTANNFVNGCGLFMLDRIRPVIESLINLSLSIVLAIKIGIAGVFIGTVVSGLLTYFWREPHLLFRKFFQMKSRSYWLAQSLWIALTAVLCILCESWFRCFGNDLFSFVLKMVLSVLIPNTILTIVFFRTSQFRYYVSLVKKKIGEKVNTK